MNGERALPRRVSVILQPAVSCHWSLGVLGRAWLLTRPLRASAVVLPNKKPKC